MDLKKFFEVSERGTQALIAKKIKAHQPDIYRWASKERPVPINKCYAIEQATNGLVTRKDLRPNDWHLIWPELVDKEVEPK